MLKVIDMSTRQEQRKHYNDIINAEITELEKEMENFDWNALRNSMVILSEKYGLNYRKFPGRYFSEKAQDLKNELSFLLTIPDDESIYKNDCIAHDIFVIESAINIEKQRPDIERRMSDRICKKRNELLVLDGDIR